MSQKQINYVCMRIFPNSKNIFYFSRGGEAIQECVKQFTFFPLLASIVNYSAPKKAQLIDTTPETNKFSKP